MGPTLPDLVARLPNLVATLPSLVGLGEAEEAAREWPKEGQ